MEKLGLNEIRSKFRDFYVSKGHYPAKSASLIPRDDKSLLIINSGMAPLKPYFAGIEEPPAKRMTTCQKCIRTGDIENVGYTSRHGTFFEMLGNFSFGDYFKRESITWGWEFITQILKMPTDRLWATVYIDDDEAYNIWKDEVGLPEERIVRLGKEDNFWEIGLGPCGPCSEIYYDRGEEYGCDNPDCKPGCDCDRYIEFWNHVFTQFSKEEDGSYIKLEHPNIDTGMGLERIACIMQGVDSIFDIDTIRHILKGVEEISGVTYTGKALSSDVSMRIITDHIRSTVFMIGDGIKPSNEGRGYVLRRLIRRAIRHGKLLGINRRFLVDLSSKVMEVSGQAYPEIVEKKDYIQKVIQMEEEKFNETLEQGMNILEGYVEDLKASGKDTLSGERVFKLYDTYGFPVELTEEILSEEGLKADLDGYKKHMEIQKEMARSGRKSTEGEAWKEAVGDLGIAPTIFVGYDNLEYKSNLLAIVKDGMSLASLGEGNTAVIYLDESPFYPEGGGQASDTGYISNKSFNCKVTKVERSGEYIAHFVEILKGSMRIGERVLSNVNIYKRNQSARNHTATHLLQKALRTVLGTHVEQAGSSVNENFLRFDFSHFEPVTKEELREVENLVNQKITEFLPVTASVTSMEEAREMGAMALFGEKYGDQVRVVKAGDFSTELCGGTHVSNTGQIGVFKITSESGVAAGVRRIEAVTSMGLLKRERTFETLLAELEDIAKSSQKDIVNKISQLVEENKELKKELAQAQSASMDAGLDDLINSGKVVNGVKLIAKEFDGVTIDKLRELSDKIKGKEESTMMVFAGVNGPKVTFMVSLTDDLTAKGMNAGKIIKEIAAACGGGGGGKADMAQAGGKDPSKLPLAFKVAEEILARQ